MAISLPSRTAAIMPHPHEQKLHEVVNSLTFASLSSWLAALTLERSRISASASPTPPPTAIFNQLRRLMEVKLSVLGLVANFRLPPFVRAFSIESMVGRVAPSARAKAFY